MALDLCTTDTEIHTLWETVHGARAGSATVRVDKEALRHLLTDHATLYGAATGPAVRFDGRRNGKGHRVNAGADQESLAGAGVGQ
jgi:hypothetical protein